MGLHSLSLFALTATSVIETYGDSRKAGYHLFSGHHRAYVPALGAVAGDSARRDQIGYEAGARGPRARNLRPGDALSTRAWGSDYNSYQTTGAVDLRPGGGAKRSAARREFEK